MDSDNLKSNITSDISDSSYKDNNPVDGPLIISNSHDSHDSSFEINDNSVASRLEKSNELVATKLLESNKQTADSLQSHNAYVQQLATTRFDKQKKWNIIHISLSLVTLIILLLFTIAFFKFAIIVRT